MSAIVNVLLDILSLLVPEGLVAARVVHDHVDGGRATPSARLGDAALLQREVIGEHRHPAPGQRAGLPSGPTGARQHPF